MIVGITDLTGIVFVDIQIVSGPCRAPADAVGEEGAALLEAARVRVLIEFLRRADERHRPRGGLLLDGAHGLELLRLRAGGEAPRAEGGAPGVLDVLAALEHAAAALRLDRLAAHLEDEARAVLRREQVA